MERREPHAFIFFAIVISIILLVFTAAAIFSKYGIHNKSQITLGFIMMIVFALSSIGVYAGIRYKTEEKKLKRLNLIGLIGNIIVAFGFIVFMIIVILMK